MEFILVFLLFTLGLLFIIKGGDFFVDASSWIAEISGIPNFLIGATVVSIATTLPELFVSVIASAQGQTGMAVGNVIGSVTANTALILALSFLFAPALVPRKSFVFKGVMMLISAITLFVLCISGELNLLPSLFLFIILAVFIYESVISAKKEFSECSKRRVKNNREIALNVMKFILGAAGIVIGADLLVDNGTVIAEKLGVPESIVGVTMLAIGTSLPELTTAITALIKKKGSLSLGNVIGANIIDMTLILPLCSAVSRGSLAVGKQAIKLDFPFCILAVIIAVVPTFVFGKTKRWQGGALMALYFCYIAFLLIYFI